MTLKLIFSVFAFSFSLAQAASDSPGCLPVTRFLAIAEIYQLDPAASDAAEMIRQLRQIKVKACAGEYSSSSSVYYLNGKTATSLAGSDSASWYWPNGAGITSLAGSASASVYFPNGKTFTSLFLSLGSSYYYSNGKSLTSDAGRKGASIYDTSGRTLSSNAPAFEKSGLVDLIELADYVVGLHGGNGDPIADCSKSELVSGINISIELVRAGRNNEAIDKLKEVKNCLK